MAVRKVDDTFVISSNQVWLPGRYESERTAKYAFRFSDEVLQALQTEANKLVGGVGGVITFADLQKARKQGFE